MFRSRGDSSLSIPDKIFAGVRFVLFGFDSVSESQYSSELVRRGGVDVGRYDQTCTHVIVCGRVHDDPVCVAARDDRKMLVTELWVNDSLDLGIMADASRTLYHPVKDLNGIPGSKSLHICLTGYQRQERENIMKMVSLMGAKFSKPLLANQVTHLICFKFEGEKYELAKKVNIKLINHQWLEDCLKAWEILPLDNYTKSGWEVEVLKAEAKDSDEEADVGMKSLENSSTRKSSFGVERSTAVGSDLSIQSLKGLRFPKVLDTTVVSAFAGNTTNDALFTTPCKDNGSRNDTCNVTRKGCEKDVRNYVQANGNHGIRETMIDAELFNRPHSDIKEAHSLSSETASTSKVLDVKSGNLTYPRRPQSQSVSPEPLVHTETSKPFADKVNSDISLSEEKASIPGDESSNLQGLTSQDGRRNLTTPKSVFPQKRKLSVSGGVSKSPKSECQSSTHSQQYPSPNTRSTDQACNVSPQDKKDPEQLMGTDHPMKDAVFSTSASKQAAFSRFKSIAYKNKSSRHEKLRIENNSNDVFTPLSKNETEICSSKQALVEQKSRKENSPNAERMVTDVSLSDSKGLLNLSLDHGKMQVDDHRDIMRTTGNQSGSLAIGELTDGAFCNGGRPEMSTGDLEEPELGTKSLSGGTANSKQILVSEEHNHSHRSAQGKTSLSPDGRASVNGNSSCILNTDAPKRNNVIVASIARTRKTVAKMSFSSRSKLNEKKNSEDKIVLDPDKAPMIAEISKAEMKVTEDKKQSGNLKGGLVESFSVGNVLPERTEAAGCPMPTSTTKAVSMDVAKQAPLVDAEKNIPEEAVRFNPNRGKNQKNKLLKTGDQELLHSSNRSKMGTKNRKISNLEPSWFIVSGHRVQRKEFQAMIKRLRGRVCRDSHHWSFQATHFITPEPVRRTEKFFAAAAAGRWILKPDYLTASCEAGRLLDEESYEYYSKGLTEDGAISLEGPRKWRILRQRTGHGAFYKMRIVIYGECIAPTLDTLKRVIKAGDGTILATSPPYSRFLKSGFDFAVVSPSMPRVDSWVQEFLRHEIPCIAADYLVEYACKPGYSLERHVLYKTHSWANKSFENLLRCSEEIIEDCTMSSDESSDDLSCAVCGSRDRGEVMLICGDEAGKVGCGIGTHIDCCDPPLQSVPEDDWLCSKCSSTPNIAPFKKRQPKRSSKR